MKYRKYSCAFIIIITINYHKKVTELNSFRLRQMVRVRGTGCNVPCHSFHYGPGRVVLLLDYITELVPCKLLIGNRTA